VLKNVKLAASLMCADLLNLERDIRELEEAGIDYLHLDIMDGHFVPNLTLGVDIVRSVRTKTNLLIDTHLMVDNPEKFVPAFVEAGSDMISVHLEATSDPLKSLRQIKKADRIPGLALRPQTSLSKVKDLLAEVSYILLMMVNPGFAGQRLIPSALSKIGNLKQLLNERSLTKDIEADGNVSFAHAPRMVKEGSTILVVGTSSVFQPSLSISQGLKKLENAIGRSTRR